MLRVVTHIRRQYASFRASRAKTVSIESVVDGEIARIEGTVLASDTTVSSFFTQRDAVLFVNRLRVKEYEHDHSGTDSVVWQTKVVAEGSVPFWLVDDAGNRAFVVSEDAEVNLRMVDVGDHERVNDDNPRLRAFLAKHGVPCVAYMGYVSDNEFSEVLLTPGDRVSVSGRCRMTSVRAGAEFAGYRDDHRVVPKFADEGRDPVVLMPARAC